MDSEKKPNKKPRYLDQRGSYSEISQGLDSQSHLETSGKLHLRNVPELKMAVSTALRLTKTFLFSPDANFSDNDEQHDNSLPANTISSPTGSLDYSSSNTISAPMSKEEQPNFTEDDVIAFVKKLATIKLAPAGISELHQLINETNESLNSAAP